MPAPTELPTGSPHPTPGPVLGVLGGIASGKSAVAALLAGPGGLVIDADRIATEVLESAEVVARLREVFGAGVLDGAGRPIREALARLVFADPGAREQLEGWIHPAVRARISSQLEEARRRGVSRIVLDVPLLLENDSQHGLAELCDVLVFVDADAAERDRRAVRSRGWQPGEVARREATQLSPADKKMRADHVIQNEGSLAELEAAVKRLLEELDACR